MMRFKKLASTVLIAGVLLTVVFYTLLPFLVKKEYVQDLLIKNVEHLTGGSLSIEKVNVQYFPALVATASNLSLSRGAQKENILQANSAAFHLNVFSYFLGKTSITSLSVSGGTAKFELSHHLPLESIILSDLSFRLAPLKPKTQMKLDMTADLFGASKVFKISGIVQVEQLDQWDWNQLRLEGELGLHKFALGELADEMNNKESFIIKDGILDGVLQLKKMKDETKVDMKGKLNLQQWTYQVPSGDNLLTSPPIDGELDIDVSWEPGHNEMLLKHTVLTSPIGKVEATGGVLFETGELKNMRLTATGVALENAPQYFVFLKDAIPFKFGFSGTSDIDLSMEGTWDHLSLHANWDLTKTLLAYSRYFTKPKDLPLNLVFDFLVKDGKNLSGDFSIRVQEASFKGNFTDLNLRNGAGQLNLLTNKFNLKGWETLLPPFANYKMSGDAKLLFNLNGSLLAPKEAQPVINLTVDDGDFLRSDGFGIHHLNLYLDYGPVALEIKKAQFQLNDYPVLAEITIYDLTDKPTMKAIVSSERLDPSLFINTLREISGELFQGVQAKSIDHDLSGLAGLLKGGEPLQNFAVQMGYDERRILTFKDLQFEAYDAKAKFQIVVDTAREDLKYLIDSEIDRLSLARFFAKDEKLAGQINGNLFLRMKLEGGAGPSGDFWDAWSGSGDLAVTNGDCKALDVLGAVAEVSELSLLKQYLSGKTDFDDLRSKITLKDGKLSASDFVFVSRDMNIEGAGDVASEGRFNFRLNAYLSSVMTEKVLKDIYGNYEARPGELFGPIPILLSGKPNEFDLRMDPSYLPQLREQILKKKPQLNFRNFLPEKDFFDK